MSDTFRVVRQHDPCPATCDLCAMEAGDRLRQARERAGLSRAQLAARLGYSVSGVGALENGQNNIKPHVARALAASLGVSPEWLLYGGADLEEIARESPASNRKRANNLDITPIERSIPVLGDARAGSWEFIPDDPEVQEWLPMEVPGYEGAELFAVRVRGRSMDLIYPDGTYVVCGPPAQTGLQEGDCVVVRRRDASGRTETTLKQIERQPDGTYVLCPRSSDPSFEAIPMPGQVDPTSQEGAEILGVVLIYYGKERKGRGPLIRWPG